jgi:hypothetical protein
VKFIDCKSCIFTFFIDMHKKTPYPDVDVVSTGTIMQVELSNVVAMLTFFYRI